MARRLLTALVAACAIATISNNSLAEARRGFVDKHRQLQDVNMGEEEVGAFGQEQTVIEASMQDSTSAKSTSAVHVPHKDTKTADITETKVEENWSDDDIKVMEGMKAAEGKKTPAINSTTPSEDGAEGDQLQEGEEGEELEKEPELTEEELELQKLDEENKKIEENFEAYTNLDAAAETKKIQEKEMAKNKKKAEIHLLEPRARPSERGYNNTAPCGGTEKGPIHFMASTGSRNYIQWKTLKSHKTSNCTVRISTGSENSRDFQVLVPRDDSANHEGKFPCGRNGGFEGKEFRFPGDMNCVNCIIQFEQVISDKETIHQCADLTILERLTTDPLAALKAKTTVNACGGTCLNGGQCQNGECNCRDGFEGQFCDEEEEGIAAELVFFFIIIVVLIAAAGLFFYSKKIKVGVTARIGNGNAAVQDQDERRRLNDQNQPRGGNSPPR